MSQLISFVVSLRGALVSLIYIYIYILAWIIYIYILAWTQFMFWFAFLFQVKEVITFSFIALCLCIFTRICVFRAFITFAGRVFNNRNMSFYEFSCSCPEPLRFSVKFWSMPMPAKLQGSSKVSLLVSDSESVNSKNSWHFLCSFSAFIKLETPSSFLWRKAVFSDSQSVNSENSSLFEFVSSENSESFS